MGTSFRYRENHCHDGEASALPDLSNPSVRLDMFVGEAACCPLSEANLFGNVEQNFRLETETSDEANLDSSSDQLILVLDSQRLSGRRR
jgi:hypothetical protein